MRDIATFNLLRYLFKYLFRPKCVPEVTALKIAWKKVKEVKSWAPTLLGAAAGIAVGAWVIDWVRQQVATVPEAAGWGDWAARVGVTFLGLVIWVSVGDSKILDTAIRGAAFGLTAVGVLGIIQKLLGMTPTTIGALRPATLAARPVVVTRKQGIPSYGRAGVVAMPTY